MTGTRRRSPLAAALVCGALVVAACSSGESSRGPTTTSGTADVTSAVEEESLTTDPPGVDDEPVATTAPVIGDGEIVEDVIDGEDSAEQTLPVSGGTLKFAIEADVSGLNPTASPLSAAGRNMASAVFDTLTAFDVDGEAVPFLAESIEPVDGDLTRWRLVVREGITFHDGTPLTAEAIQINYEAQLASPLIGLAQRPFFPQEGATTVIDDRTIEFAMIEPNAVFPSWLTSQLGMVASPTWLAAAAADPALNQEPVGTGPFVFVSRSQESSTRFVRNDDWWGGEVYLDDIEFLPVPDPSSRADLLLGGDIEGLHVNDPAVVGDLRDDDSLQNVLDETGQEQFVMLNTSVPPFDDIRARQALTLATPLQLYRDLIGLGIARGANQMFVPESVNFNPDVVQLGDDPAGAAALVAEYCADVPASCTDGKIDIEFQHPGPAVVNIRQAEILANGWAELFNIELDQLIQPQLVQQTAFGQFQATMWRGFGGLEPANQRHTLMCRTIAGGISLNGPRFCSEERDALILEAQAGLDESARAEHWQRIVQDVADSYTYVFLLHTTWDNAFVESVRGVCDRTSPDGVPLRCVVNGVSWFDSVWLDG